MIIRMKIQWFKKKEYKQVLDKSKSNKILIVDDSNINRYVIKKTIENLYGAQYIIEEADNGLNAIEKCKVEEYRIIFIDIKMPIMNGDIAVKEIRKFNNTSFICGITGQIENYKEYLNIGMNKCISKPIDKKILKLIIDDYENNEMHEYKLS